MEAMMAETEALVRQVLDALAPTAFPILGQACDASAVAERLTVCEAFERFADLAPDETLRLASEDEDAYFRALVERVEPGLASLGVPVWLYLYPASQASLARLHPADPRLAERFELYVADLELCNGFCELTDPDEQRQRLERDQRDRAGAGLPIYPLDEAFLAALNEGLPPCSGNALGLDRLVALALGASSVAEVMAFPQAQL
jgi:lysyl-tRNA synthetase class 2